MRAQGDIATSVGLSSLPRLPSLPRYIHASRCLMPSRAPGSSTPQVRSRSRGTSPPRPPASFPTSRRSSGPRDRCYNKQHRSPPCQPAACCAHPAFPTSRARGRSDRPSRRIHADALIINRPYLHDVGGILPHMRPTHDFGAPRAEDGWASLGLPRVSTDHRPRSTRHASSRTYQHEGIRGQRTPGCARAWSRRPSPRRCVRRAHDGS
ncbi:hypothetical protein BC628DRAFT_800901 [Trametes gibbosa]|nr:hypothetical protein BC628DRAFT_800901 [Trametes gibbosa]